MKLCKTCKYWGEINENTGAHKTIIDENGVTRATCTCPLISSDFETYEHEYETSPQSVIIHDWEHSGWITPGPDFGCVNHKEI